LRQKYKKHQKKSLRVLRDQKSLYICTRKTGIRGSSKGGVGRFLAGGFNKAKFFFHEKFCGLKNSSYLCTPFRQNFGERPTKGRGRD
jgi:hypothetical protein